MLKAKYAAILAIAAIVMSVAVVTASDGSDGATGGFTARVFVGDGTESGTTELSGSGSDLEEILLDALSGRIEMNANGTVNSLDGVGNADGKKWYILQWRPPTGWVSVLANSSGNAYLDDGTSYYVYYSDVTTGSDGKDKYSTPSSFKPVGTSYFYIKFVTDVNANDYVMSVLTEEQRLEGFWISGEGSNIAEAFMNACSELRGRGNTGFQLEINDDPNNELYGWLGTFMGLEDDDSPGGGLWNNWSQFSWNKDTGRWEYNNWCLGYYDPGVYPYFSIVRQITADDSATAGVGVTPSDIPSCVKSGSCTVRFVDGDGVTLKTQTVPYFGSATAPSNPTKNPSDGVTYTFTGWDMEFDQVIADITVTAQFSSSGSPTEPDEPDEPGDEGVRVTAVSITASKGEMQVGESFRFVATVTPSNAENRDVTWSTSNPSVVSVDGNGNVRALSEGTATITVTTVDGGRTAFTTVKVSGVAESISLSTEFLAMKRGDSVTIVATTSNGSPVVWESNTPSVATVDQNGKVTVVSDTGSAVITARSGDLVATCKVVSISEENVEEITREDMSGTGQDSYVVQFTGSHMEVLETIGEGYTLETDIGTVTFSNEALKAIGDDGTLRVALAVPTSGQAAVIGDSILYEYTVNGGAVSQLGGTVTISMPYDLPAGADADDVVVCQIDPRGNILESIDCVYADGCVTFETTHFSTYFATTGSPASDDGGDGGGSDAMLYVGIAAAIAVVALVAIVAMRRHA